MCEITVWTWLAQADDVAWHLTHFQCLRFSSSLEFFLLLHYRQAKCIIYCLTLMRWSHPAVLASACCLRAKTWAKYGYPCVMSTASVRICEHADTPHHSACDARCRYSLPAFANPSLRFQKNLAAVASPKTVRTKNTHGGMWPTLKPRTWFYFDEKCSNTKIKESVACKQNKTPLYIQLHTPGYVRRFKREQMSFLISFREYFNLKVWFLWLLINPYPVYLQAKDFSYQNRVISPFEWFDMPLHLYTLNSL